MSKWEKLIHDILKEDPNLRFEDLSITIPKHKSLKRVYVSMVAEIVKEQLKEESDE